MELESERNLDAAIVLRFVSHPGPFNRLVQFAQYGMWASHVEAIRPDGNAIGSWFYGGGVQVRPHDYDAGGFSREEIVHVPCRRSQAETFYAFMDGQIGKPYDWLSILAFVSGRDWQEDDSWSCSELVGSGLAACCVFPPKLAVSFNRLTPRDVYEFCEVRQWTLS